MTEFTPSLRQISARLSVPEPIRSRILLEIASDMEDLLDHHLAEGMDRSVGVEEVLARFDLSGEALRELEEVHRSTVQRSLDGLLRQAATRWERGILAVLALFFALGLLRFLLTPDLVSHASPLVIALLGLVGLGLVQAVRLAFALFRRPGLPDGFRRKRLLLLPVLSGLLVAAGFAGVWVELYRRALLIREGPDAALVVLVHWVQTASATMVVALSGGLLLGLLWFFLESRASQVEAVAAAELLRPSA